jgi:hypothetical protein
MLFDGTDREDRDNALDIKARKVLRRQIPPPMRFKDHT